MNPNAKEFVPAHLLKKRQEEAVGEITSQISNVGIDESKKDATQGNGATNNPSAVATAATTCSRGKAQDQAQENGSPAKQTEDGLASGGQHNSQQQSNNHHSSTTNNVQQHHKTNGDSNPDPNENDRHLLRAGENYCEFNGEQFIIPGEDDEYQSSGQDYQHPGYDFGNVEDNEDEDVCNAYEEFLNDLPQ